MGDLNIKEFIKSFASHVMLFQVKSAQNPQMIRQKLFYWQGGNQRSQCEQNSGVLANVVATI